MLALLVGLAGTLTVSRLLTHTAAVAASPTAQYLPSAVSRAEQPAPGFSLRDQAGQTVSLSALRGQVVLVTFMDPQCTNLCPIVGKELGLVESALPAAVRPVLLVVSVAPGRTAADVSSFVSHVSWSPGWHWLLGNQSELQAVWARYHVAVVPSATDVGHDTVVYIVDPKGGLVAGYNAPLPVGEVASVITTHSQR